MTRYIDIYKNKVVVLPEYSFCDKYDGKDEKILRVEVYLNSLLNDVFTYKLNLNKLNLQNMKDDNIYLPIELNLCNIPKDDKYILYKPLNENLELCTNWSYFLNYKVNYKLHYVNLKKLIELIDDNFKDSWFIELYRKYCYKGELIEQLYSLTYDELYSMCKYDLDDGVDNDDVFIDMEKKYPEMKDMFKDRDRNKMIDIIKQDSNNLLKYIISSMTLNYD